MAESGIGVLVAVKRVPDSSSEVLLTADAQAVDGSKAGFTTSPHEECAVEIATQVVAGGGEATVVTIGDKDAAEQLRNALAVGCTQATHVVAEAHTLGPADIARELAAVVKDHEAAGRVHDLVLLGSDASDTGDFQVGIRLAYELGRPVVNGATTVTVEDSPDGSKSAVAIGKGPEGQETYRVPLPAVVTIREGGVEPRYPSVKGRMAAKKVQIEEREPVSEHRGPQRVKLLLPPPTPSSVQILGEGPAAAPAVVDLFEQLGVLSR
jgi:electron transfer flavoprotein beta subunit